MMTFRNPIFTYIILSLFLKFCIIIIFILLIILLREVLNNKSSEYRYRIKYFSINWLIITMYIVGYFGVILYIRIKYFNESTDLKPYIEKIKTLYNHTNIIDFLCNITIVVLGFIIIVFIFACIHKFFLIQLTKRFLILHVVLTYNLRVDFSKYLLLFILQKFFDRLILKILRVLFDKYSTKLSNLLWQISWRFINFIFMTAPTILLFLILCHTLIYNNLTISSTFYKYLIFYFIYIVNKRIAFFIDQSDLGLNTIIYRMYYLERSYWYVNIPGEYQEVIERYLNLGLSRDPQKNPEPLLDNVIGQYAFFMNTECCYCSNDGHVYANSHAQFIEKDNTRQDIRIDYSFLNNLTVFIQKYYNITCLVLIISLSLIESILILLLKYYFNTINIFYLNILYLSDIMLCLIGVGMTLYIFMILFYENINTKNE